jgi:hypothetical protein
MNLWLTIILLLILFILSVLLFSSIFFHLVLDDKRKRGSFKWLCGSFYWDWSDKMTGFKLFNLRMWRGSLEKKEKPKKKKVKKKKKGPSFMILWQEKRVMVKTANVAFSSAGDLLRKSKVDRFLLDANVGTPDPALTGVLYGGISSISYPLQSFLPNTTINVYPDFETQTFRGNTEISLKTKVRDLFWIVVRAFFLLPKVAIIRLIRKLKKSRR